MCGINGITGIYNIEESTSIVQKMNAAMQHRGPDDEGVFSIEGIALGHRRLSIIDLSDAGHQPMFSEDQSCVVAFNGEIYNFKSIKEQIIDYSFVTHTDTEVILAAYQKWGLDFVQQLDGMFAIALYDFRIQKLFLIRDRLGVKPLYYFNDDFGKIIFASEIRSILSTGRVKRKLNETELSDYLTLQTTVGENTLIENIYSLLPGHIATVEGNSLSIKKYWDINSFEPNLVSFEQAKKSTKQLFFNAVEKRLISDVPLGAFLSGGIDSSAVVAAMSEYSSNVNTFNINFNEKQYSEAEFADLISKKYKTNHTRIDLKASDFLEMFPDALNAMDVPSWDGINTFVVSKAAKNAGISVALSGIGGDEWFGGYPVFNLLNNHKFNNLKLIPFSLRKMIGNTIPKLFENYATEKKFELLSSDISVENCYYTIRKLFSEKQMKEIINLPEDFKHHFYPHSNNYSDISIAEWQNYLMPVLLRDTDQMSMAHALEIREPFLDYQLIEYVLSLPDEIKKGNTTKSLLVKAMGDLLPSEVVNRPKQGFVLPWQNWLKSDLKEFVNEGIDELCGHNAFNAITINNLRNDYYSNRRNIRWTMILNLTVLGYWMKKNGIR